MTQPHRHSTAPEASKMMNTGMGLDDGATTPTVVEEADAALVGGVAKADDAERDVVVGRAKIGVAVEGEAVAVDGVGAEVLPFVDVVVVVVEEVVVDEVVVVAMCALFLQHTRDFENFL